MGSCSNKQPVLRARGERLPRGRALSSAPALRPCFSVLGGDRDPASRVLLAVGLVPSARLAFPGPREEAALGPTPSGTCRA